MNYLTPKQTACAARIFLNLFGFGLEENEDIEENTKLKIYDKDNNIIGSYSLEDNKIVINAEYQGILLQASCNLPNVYKYPNYGSDVVTHASWTSPFVFELIYPDRKRARGVIKFACSLDTEYGIRCTCHSEFSYIMDSNNTIRYQLFNDGNLFSVSQIDSGYHESINILAEYNEFIGYSAQHQIIDRLPDGEYRKFATVYELSSEKDKVKVMLREYEEVDGNERKIASEDYEATKIDEKDCDLKLKQNLDMLKRVDPTVFDKIKRYSNIVKIGDTNLIENLAQASFDSYPDYLFEELFGFERDRFIYQDGAYGLKESYFGVSSSEIKDTKKIAKKLLGEWK